MVYPLLGRLPISGFEYEHEYKLQKTSNYNHEDFLKFNVYE